MSLTLIYRSKIIISAYEGWIPPHSKILDIGCGNGVVSQEIRKHFRCFITGTDILDYCKRRVPFKPMTQDNKLPFKDKEFEIAIFSSVLSHCQDPKSMLSEALRVANRVLIFEVEPSIMVKAWDRFIDRIYHPQMALAINLKTSEQWKVNLKELNFEYRQVRTSWWYPFRHFAFKIG